MRTFFNIVFVLIILFKFISCDPGFILSINNEEKYTIEMPIGNVQLSCYGMSGIYLKQEYNVDKEITINTNTVNIQYQNRIIEYSFYDENQIKIKDEKITFKGKKLLYIIFYLKEEFKKADTITISAPGFITYNGDYFTLESLIIKNVE